MALLKYAGDRIFTGTSWHGSDHVVIADTSGRIEAVVPKADAGEDVWRVEGILSAGFINCHVHVELSHLRGKLKAGSGMTDFLLSVIRQRKQDAASVNEAAMKALDEMYQNGISGAGDICNTLDSLAPTKHSPILFHHFIETIGIDSSLAAERFMQGYQLYETFKRVFPVRCSIVPHAPYTVSPDLFKKIASFSGNKILSVHSQESHAEDAFLRQGTGPFLSMFEQLKMTALHAGRVTGNPLEYLLSFFSTWHNLLLVHNVTTSASDIAFLQRHKDVLPSLIFCLCPRANQYIGNGMPDIPLLMASGFPIVLGTDSLASNAALSILDEMRCIHTHFPAIPLEKLWSWATIDGARALQMHDTLGSLAPGKRPGLICCTQDLTRVTRLI